MGRRPPSLRLSRTTTRTVPPSDGLVQLGPDLRARPRDQQPDGLARVAEGQDEERVRRLRRRGPSVLRRSRLVLLRGAGDDGPRRRAAAGASHSTRSRRSTRSCQMAALRPRPSRALAVGLAGARDADLAGPRTRPVRRWWTPHEMAGFEPAAPTTTPAVQVAAGRLAPDPGRPLDAPQRPAARTCAPSPTGERHASVMALFRCPRFCPPRVQAPALSSITTQRSRASMASRSSLPSSMRTCGPTIVSPPPMSFASAAIPGFEVLLQTEMGSLDPGQQEGLAAGRRSGFVDAPDHTAYLSNGETLEHAQ